MTRKSIVFVLLSIVIVLAVGVGVWSILSSDLFSSVSGTNETVETETTTVAETTTIAETTTVLTTILETTTVLETTTEEETEAVEITTVAEAETGYFYVVTDGVVDDDDSLEGLTGLAKVIGEVILAAGFRYDSTQQIFYSDTESWQRDWGFAEFYDLGAALMNMNYDTIRFRFYYGDYYYMFQVWKGRYGITTGGEMGVYYRDADSESVFFHTVDDDDMVTMSFALFRDGELYFTRGPVAHWWLTGFKVLDLATTEELTMHCTWFLDDTGLADALEQAIIDYGFVKNVNYKRTGDTITIVWT